MEKANQTLPNTLCVYTLPEIVSIKETCTELHVNKYIKILCTKIIIIIITFLTININWSVFLSHQLQLYTLEGILPKDLD